jgi:hypothetical protein
MTVRDRFHHWLSPSLFALILLCSLLPFATVSCDNASTSFTGLQLVTRTVPPGGVLREGADCSSDISVCVERDAATTAEIAFGAALVGLAIGLLGFVRGPGWCAAAGLAAITALQFEGPVLGPDVSFHAGYELPLLLFVFLWCLHVRRAYRRRRPRSRPKRPLGVHLGALVLYAFAAFALSVLAAAPRGIAHEVGTVGFGWLLLAVAPTWLVLGALLIGRRRQGRDNLVERAARWDYLLWLGPFLAFGLVSRKLRTFLFPGAPAAI